MFWPTFGYFIIFDHLFLFSYLQIFQKQLIKNKKNKQKILNFFFKERTHFDF